MTKGKERYELCALCLQERTGGAYIYKDVRRKVREAIKNDSEWLNPFVNSMLNTDLKKLCYWCPYVLEHVTLAQVEVAVRNGF